MSHPKGYTKEMIREILGTSCPEWDENYETGNQMRRRKGNEMRAGKRPYPKYPSKESRIADTSGMFDDEGQYVYPPNSGFNWVEKCDPNHDGYLPGGKVS